MSIRERGGAGHGTAIIYLSAAVLPGVLCVGLACGCGPQAAGGAARSGRTAAAGPAHKTELRFTNLATRAGLRFTPDRTLRPPLDILQTAGYGGGVLDYDGDGWLDVLLVGNPRCRLFRNTHDGHFVDVTRAAGLDLDGHWMGCAASDFDNDGWTDLFLSGYHAAALLRNEGGRFHRLPLQFPADDWGTSAVFFDYDRDGWPDLYVGCYVRFGRGTPRLCSFGGIQAACAPTHYDAQAGHLYHNLKGKAFRETTGQAGLTRTHGKTLGVAACDYDGNGWQDLYLANDGMPGDMFRNLNGRFKNVGLESGTAFNQEGREQAGMGVDWGDCNEDGRPDLVVTTFQFEPTSLYMNLGGGVFREVGVRRGVGDATINSLGFGAKFFDADGDGHLDLILANGHVQDAIGRIQAGVGFSQPAQLFQWWDGRYEAVTGDATADVRKPIVGRGVATGDYDNDGRTDVLITNLEGSPLLLHNETGGPASGHSGHWLSLRLEARSGPRDGSGTVVTVQAGGRTVTRYAGTGGGYLSTSDPRVHLGLGAASRIDRLTVHWAGGEAETWRDLPVDRQLNLRQGVRAANENYGRRQRGRGLPGIPAGGPPPSGIPPGGPPLTGCPPPLRSA
jgi:hypothetical protein